MSKIRAHYIRRAFLIAAGALGSVAALLSQAGTIAPAPYLTVLDNSGRVVSLGCVWTYAAGTTTPATTYSDVTLATPNANPVKTDSAGRVTIFLAPGQSYKFTIENAPCSAISHGTVLRTADNLSAVPATATTTDVVGTAGETMSAGTCAYLSDGSGAKNAGQWYKCDTTNTYSSIAPAIGVLPSAITSGSTGTIRMAGLVTGLSSLTAGAAYYVGASGALSTSVVANARIVGVAHSTTSLLVTAIPPQTNSLLSGKFGSLGDFAVNTNKFSVTAASGNTAIAGTLDVTGSTALSSVLNVGGNWPTVQIGKALTRTGIFTTAENGTLIVGNMQAGVAVDRGGDLYLGARGTTAIDDFTYVMLRGARESASSANFSSYFTVRTMNAAGTESEKLRLSSAGALKLTTSSGTYTEQNRSFAMGATQTRTYAGGNYTAATGSWTVDSGDITAETYRVVGDTMWLSVDIRTSTLSNNTASVTIATPAGFTIAETGRQTGVYVVDAGGVNLASTVTWTASGNIVVTLQNAGNFLASTNLFSVAFQIFFKVS